MRVRVLGENASQRGLADVVGALRSELLKMSGDFVTIVREQHFNVRLEELLNALPVIGNEACAGAGRFEDACGWRKAEARHAFAVHVQDGGGGAVKGIMIARVDVPDVIYVWRERLVLPAIAAEEEF